MNLRISIITMLFLVSGLTACGGSGAGSSTAQGESQNISGSPTIDEVVSQTPEADLEDTTNENNGEETDGTSDTDTSVTEQTLAITSQPSELTVASGTTINLSLNVTSSSEFTVQWRRDGAVVSNSASYEIITSKTSDTGVYDCIVTSGDLSRTCENFNINVLNPPAVTSSTGNQVVTEGDNVVLSIDASGTDITYQWYFDNDAIIGADSYQLTLGNIQADESGTYYCEVSNSVGTADSTASEVSVIVPVQTANVEVAWEAPSSRTDGSPLMESEIAGFRVYYGEASEAGYANSVETNSDSFSVVIHNLDHGDYKFALSTIDVDGLESELSDEILLAVN